MTTYYLVRPEGFEPPAYGFEVRAAELPNLLNLLQHTVTIRLKISTFLSILHILADFGIIFSHNSHTELNKLTDFDALDCLGQLVTQIPNKDDSRLWAGFLWNLLK